jgi:hypothetical protein
VQLQILLLPLSPLLLIPLLLLLPALPLLAICPSVCASNEGTSAQANLLFLVVYFQKKHRSLSAHQLVVGMFVRSLQPDARCKPFRPQYGLPLLHCSSSFSHAGYIWVAQESEGASS